MPYTPEQGTEYPNDQLAREFANLAEQLDRIANVILQNLPWKAIYVKLDGNGVSNPTVVDQFNVSGVTRLGVGLYRVQLISEIIRGISFVDHVYVNDVVTVLAINQPADTEHFIVEVADTDPTAGHYDLQVFGFHVPPNDKLTLVPYDILPGDDLEFSGTLNLGDGVIIQTFNL